VVQRRLHGQLAGQQVGRVLLQHAVGDAGVGEHFGHRLVQVVGHAGRQFTQRVEPGDLAQAQQLMGPLAVGALAQQGAGSQQQQGHEQRPAGHLAPGQRAPADMALGHDVERLAGAGQGLDKREIPSTGGICRNLAGLQHEERAGVFERDAHRAGLGRHGPFAPGHHAPYVDLHRVAGRLAGHHQLVAALGNRGFGQHGPAQLAGFRFGHTQRRHGPHGGGLAVLHRHDLRVHRLQPLLGAGRVGAIAQQCQRRQQGVVLPRTVVDQAVGAAGVGLEGLLQPVEFALAEQQAAERGNDQPAGDPGRVAV
jgi:hypothetical protein